MFNYTTFENLMRGYLPARDNPLNPLLPPALVAAILAKRTRGHAPYWAALHTTVLGDGLIVQLSDSSAHVTGALLEFAATPCTVLARVTNMQRWGVVAYHDPEGRFHYLP